MDEHDYYGGGSYDVGTYGTEVIYPSLSSSDSDTTSVSSTRIRAGDTSPAVDSDSTIVNSTWVYNGVATPATDSDSAEIAFPKEGDMEAIHDIVSYLPDWMAKWESNNESLLGPVGIEINSLHEDLEYVFDASKPQLTPKIEHLEEHGKFVGAENTTDSKSVLRAKVLVRFLMNASQGTIPQFVNAINILLDVENEDIEIYEGDDTGGVIEIYLNRSILSDIALTEDGFANILSDFSAAGFGLEIFWVGSFENQTLEEWNSGDTEPEKGYNGLDTNGEITNVGGEYTTIYEED